MSYIEEVKSKLSLAELTGYRLLIVAGKGICLEGHKGIYDISDTVIRIKVKNGSIIVNGEDLAIKEISDSEIYITGIIKGLEL